MLGGTSGHDKPGISHSSPIRPHEDNQCGLRLPAGFVDLRRSLVMLRGVMRTYTTIFARVVAIMCMFLGLATVVIIKHLVERPREAYAVQHTAELVVEYMRSHSNQWPSSWSELRTVKIGDQEYFTRFEKETGGYSGFLDELESLVVVDFNTTLSDLIAATGATSTPPFRVIWLRNGRNTHWAGLEPNEFVADYLKSITLENGAQQCNE